MKKGKKILTLAVVGAMILSGCGAPTPESTETPELTASPAPTAEAEGAGFVLPCYPAGGFHPLTGNNRLNLTLAPLLYRGLFALSRDFQAEKDLCEDYSVSEDGLVWTFRLTEAKFSDGSPLTAAEAAASLNKARESRRYAGRLVDISRVTAVGEEVEIRLSRPNGALPTLLDVPIVKETEDPLRPLGTGLYALEEAEDGELRLAAQREGTPVERIPLRTVEAGDDLVYAFDAKEISLVDTDLTGTNALGYSGWLETTDYPTTTLIYIGYNLKKGPCREPEVRKALGRAFDREKITGKLLAGHAVAAALPVHPDAPGYDKKLAEELAWDMEAAAQLLSEAGWSANEEGRFWKGRTELELRLIVNQENTYKAAVAEELAASLEELGCAVILDKLPWDDFLTALKRGEFDLFLGETSLTASFDLEELLGEKGTLNYGGFADKEWETLAENHRGARGKEWETTLVDLCAKTAELSPITPLYFKNGSLLTRWGQVSGAQPTQRDVFAGIENWRIEEF